MDKRFILCILVICSLFMSCIWLGQRSFMDYDEATYAQVYHESLVRHDILTFTYLNQPWFKKPPLYFWLMDLSGSLLGEHEFSLRVPSALLLVVTILLVYAIVVTLTEDWKMGILSGVVLLSTAYYVFAGRQVRLDIPVTAGILLSLYGFIKTREHAWWWVLFAVGLAIGVLCKSVIGLLVFGVVLIYSFVYQEYSWLREKWFWLSTVLAFVLIVPWHLYELALFG
ncbi:MAG TPA: glycosyltransferase family 39 protein, partial [Patescibacteria group bacterium]|nr:glycosyltransferase family 39 protein [Patescibacteria group bacterium]